MKLFLNHIISFARVSNIDTYIKRYKKAGFHVDAVAVRHAPGKRNRFIYFGTEYIELFWIEDKKKFKKANEIEKYFSVYPRPFGMAFEAKDLKEFRKKALRKGYNLKPIWSKGPSDKDQSDPWWTFLDVPIRYLPGIWTFALTYVKRDWNKPRKVHIGKNTIFGIAGVTFVSNKPKMRAEKWRQFLGGKQITQSERGCYKIEAGLHNYTWMTPTLHSKKYGQLQTLKSKHKKYAELSIVHLLAVDLNVAKKMLERASFDVHEHDDGLLVYPDKRDGFMFLVTLGDVTLWLQTRKRHGVKVEFPQSDKF